MPIRKLSGGTVYDLSIHLVLVTKYRKKVINSEILRRLEEISRDLCQKWDCTLVEFNGESDHIHLLIDINPKVKISSFANNLKTITSRAIRKEFSQHCDHYFYKKVFWKIGYFVSSTGGANLETVKKYICENQNTPSDNSPTTESKITVRDPLEAE